MPTTSVTKLVGTEPSPAHTALYQLYVAQVASIAASGTKPVIVSLALKIIPAADANHKMGGQDDEEAEELLMTSPEERSRFIEIMKLVQQCKVW